MAAGSSLLERRSPHSIAILLRTRSPRTPA